MWGSSWSRTLSRPMAEATHPLAVSGQSSGFLTLPPTFCLQVPGPGPLCVLRANLSEHPGGSQFRRNRGRGRAESSPSHQGHPWACGRLCAGVCQPQHEETGCQENVNREKFHLSACKRAVNGTGQGAGEAGSHSWGRGKPVHCMQNGSSFISCLEGTQGSDLSREGEKTCPAPAPRS